MADTASKFTEEGITLSLERWPIVMVKLHPQFTLEDIDRTYEELIKVAKSGRKHIHWTDLREVNPLAANALIRKRFAEWEERLQPIAKDRVVADVRIVDGAVVRGLLRAFDWISSPPPWPVGTVSNDEQAHAWLEEIGATSQVRDSQLRT